MATITEPRIEPDISISFEINPGTLLQFLEARAEKGPRLKCFEGSVTLVSPGMPHEFDADRLSTLVVTICHELGIKYWSLRSTTWKLPLGLGDTAYEPDAAYYLETYDPARGDQPPHLAIEVVVSHSATKAIRAGAFLKIPELWVFDNPSHRLTFYLLATRGKWKGTYRSASRSRAFPFLTSAEVQERLEDPEREGGAYQDNCREWARRVLVPRIHRANGI